MRFFKNRTPSKIPGACSIRFAFPAHICGGLSVHRNIFVAHFVAVPPSGSIWRPFWSQKFVDGIFNQNQDDQHLCFRPSKTMPKHRHEVYEICVQPLLTLDTLWKTCNSQPGIHRICVRCIIIYIYISTWNSQHHASKNHARECASSLRRNWRTCASRGGFSNATALSGWSGNPSIIFYNTLWESTICIIIFFHKSYI